LIGGDFGNNYVNINGKMLVGGNTSPDERLVIGNTTEDNTARILSKSSGKSTLQLYEYNDYGFEFEYDGAADALNLWSKKFSGNEAVRTKWYKNGNVEINGKITTSSTSTADMKAAMFAGVSSGGNSSVGSHNYTITKPSGTTGEYRVYVNGENFNTDNFMIMATVDDVSLGFARVVWGGSNYVKILTYNISGSPANRSFKIIAYKK